jgi:hypothetical protein
MNSNSTLGLPFHPITTVEYVRSVELFFDFYPG